MSKNKEVNTKIAVKNTAPLAVPGKIVRGFEADLDQSDILIPRAKLIQKMSDEVNDGFKEGQIINSVTKEILPATFIPCFVYKQYIRFDENKKMLWQTTNSKDPRVIAEAGFGKDGEKPLAHTYMNFFSIFDGLAMPVIIGFHSASYKVGKQLLSLAQFTGDSMFGRRYTLGSKKVSSDKGQYMIFTVNPAGIVTEDEYKNADKLWEMYSMKAADLKVHDETVAESEVPDSWK